MKILTPSSKKSREKSTSSGSLILTEQEFKKLPVKQGLVLSSEKMNRLSKRIEELIGLKVNKKLKYRKIKQQLANLLKVNMDIVKQVYTREVKCNQAMMLVFGRIVDIDSLPMVIVSRAVEESKIIFNLLIRKIVVKKFRYKMVAEGRVLLEDRSVVFKEHYNFHHH